jgi:hypothetical protein
MTSGPYFCDLDKCHGLLHPSDEVVDAVQLHHVTTQESPRGVAGDQEGIHAFFHPGHIPPGWREKGKGPLRQFRPDAR